MRRLQVIADAFGDPQLEFAGGPYLAVCAAPPPNLLPDDYLAVPGAADNGSVTRALRSRFPGNAQGRKLEPGAKGQYLPDLVIYHYTSERRAREGASRLRDSVLRANPSEMSSSHI